MFYFTNSKKYVNILTVIKMEQKKIDRISELTRISRERELTQTEQKERAELRREYIDSYKASLTGILDNTYIQEFDGTIHKLELKK